MTWVRSKTVFLNTFFIRATIGHLPPKIYQDPGRTMRQLHLIYGINCKHLVPTEKIVIVYCAKPQRI